jgi:hypothetical protein
MNEELAELFGTMIGDGCLSRYKSGKCVALLTGNLLHDYDYYINIIQPILRKNFKIEGYVYKRKKRNCVYFWMGKKVFDYFLSFDFPIGKKKELSIPRIILYDKEYSVACLRGIFNTDGSIYRRYSKKYAGHLRVYHHLVIQFKMNSKTVIEQIKEILNLLSIKTTKIGTSKTAEF